ncbi:hypothetical protein RISK_005706 [Rhodopirellula islandica]|uniref:Uncharacterized protein n=1 Tax=Rhodopirellula islandica TaxID=595434 RepID=A0A0J1B743_RHOIS|nr:hypothetical protein RISK_005706 [Rhodopirellula islandica]
MSSLARSKKALGHQDLMVAGSTIGGGDEVWWVPLPCLSPTKDSRDAILSHFVTLF